MGDPERFPHGMAYIGEELHKLGLKYGIYGDIGTYTCGGYPGSEGQIRVSDNEVRFGEEKTRPIAISRAHASL